MFHMLLLLNMVIIIRYYTYLTLYSMSLLSTKNRQAFFEIIEI